MDGLRVVIVLGLVGSLAACNQWRNPAWLDYDLNEKVSQLLHGTKPIVANDTRVVNYEQTLPTFNQVHVKGPFTLRVVQQAKKTGLKFTGQQRYVNQVMATVSGDTLEIQYAGESHADPAQPVAITLYTPHLHSLGFNSPHHAAVELPDLKSALLDLNIHNGYLIMDGKIGVRQIIASGNSRINLKGVNSESMTIHLKEYAKVAIEGFARVEEITASDHAELQAFWLDSNKLEIRLRDQAVVNLAGVAKEYHAVVHDTAHLDARYLRADTVYAKTFDQAVADISVLQKQNTLANDESNIYFHQPTKVHGDFMANRGSVIDFGDIDRWMDQPRFDFPKS